MFGTVLSLLIGAFFLFYPPITTIVANELVLTVIIIVAASLFVVAFALVQTLSWSPLQKVEQNLTPRLLDLYCSDRHFKFYNLWFTFFPLASFTLAATSFSFDLSIEGGTLAIWIVMLGVSFDLFIHYCKRVISYLNPFTILHHLSGKAIEAVQNEDQKALCHWIEAQGEIGSKAVDRFLPTLCGRVIDDMYTLIKQYLSSAKSISHHYEKKDQDHIDQVSYTLFYLFQQLEQIHERALDKRLETISSQLVTTLGKIAIAAAKYDLTMAGYPLHYIGKFAEKNESRGSGDVGEKATCTLVEVAKEIIRDVDIRYQALKDPFLILLSQLDALAKERFRKDKSMNIALLKQPFEEIRELFSPENQKAYEHQDRALIVSQINTIINRFDQLEMVLKTVPSIPGIKQEREATHQEAQKQSAPE